MDSERNSPKVYILATHKLVLPVLERKGEQVRLQPVRVARAPVTAGEAQQEVKRGLLVDVVVGQGAAIVKLLPREDEALLVRRDTYSSKTQTDTVSSSLMNWSMYIIYRFLKQEAYPTAG